MFPPIRYRRELIVSKCGDLSWQAYLVTCPWCVSVYVGGIVTGATDLVSEVPLPVWTWMAASVASGVISTVLSDG